MFTLEEKLGYRFKNRALLENALQHSSYANEHRGAGMRSNERLEFLGDAVLGVVTADYLYKKHPDLPEGDLTRIRAALVCEESLHEVAQGLDLGRHLKLGRGEEQGGDRERPSILADATESVFAAVYLDGGMEAAAALIHRVLLDKEREEAVEERRRDYKTELQELVQRKSGSTLNYRMVGSDEWGGVFYRHRSQQEGGGAIRRPGSPGEAEGTELKHKSRSAANRPQTCFYWKLLRISPLTLLN